MKLLKLRGILKIYQDNLNVTFSKNQKENDYISKSHKDYLHFSKKKDSLKNLYNNLTKEKQKESLKEYRGELKKIDSLDLIADLKGIKSNTDLYGSIHSLILLKDEIPRDTLQKVYDSFIPKLKNSEDGKLIELYLKSKITKIGDKYHEFEGVNQKGEKVKFSEIKGKSYTLLDFTSSDFTSSYFTASYCIVCGPVEGDLVKISEKYKDSLTIVSFSLDENKKTWLEEVKKGKVSWNSVFSGKAYKETKIKYGINYMPTFMLINSEGIVIAIIKGGRNLDKEIEKYIFKK